MVKHLHEEYLPSAMANFERYAKANNADEGWIFGHKVRHDSFMGKYADINFSSLQFTYADVATYLLFEYAISNIPGALQLYPTLAKQRESVTKMKNIARWLKERPETAL